MIIIKWHSYCMLENKSRGQNDLRSVLQLHVIRMQVWMRDLISRITTGTSRSCHPHYSSSTSCPEGEPECVSSGLWFPQSAVSRLEEEQGIHTGTDWEWYTYDTIQVRLLAACSSTRRNKDVVVAAWTRAERFLGYNWIAIISTNFFMFCVIH